MTVWRPEGFAAPVRSGATGVDPHAATTPANARRGLLQSQPLAIDTARVWQEVMGDRRQREEQARQPRTPSTFL